MAGMLDGAIEYAKIVISWNHESVLCPFVHQLFEMNAVSLRISAAVSLMR